jgi:hypothetical protein
VDELGEAEAEASFAVAEIMSDPVYHPKLYDLEIVIRDEARAAVSRVSVSLRRERMN